MDHPLFVRVLQPLRRLVSRSCTHCATGNGPLALTIRARSSPSTYSIAKTNALTQPEGGVGRDDVGVVKLRDGANLAQKSVQSRPGRSLMCRLITLSTSSRPMSRLCAR